MKRHQHQTNAWRLLGLLTFVIAVPAVVAQVPPGGTGQPVVETTETSFLDMIAAGGWAMYPLGFLSIAAFALTGYNFYALRKKEFFDIDTAETLRKTLGTLDLVNAKKICEENPNPLTRIVSHGLDSVRGGEIDLDLFRKRLDAGSVKELAQPFVVINYLSIIASIAPMLGLLGTVSGMVKAFNAIATVGMGQPDVLAGNISEALITTATGMIIGIPAMFFFFFFKNQYGKIVADMTMYLDDMYGEVAHGGRAHANKPQVAAPSAQPTE